MKRKVIEKGEEHVEEEEEAKHGALVKQSDSGFRLGDVTWVKHRGRSWWPAQIVDENSVCKRNKPRRKRSDEVLVRLYGSYDYLFVDPKATLVEFNNVLKRYKGSHREIIQDALKQTMGRSSKDEEEDVDDENGSNHGDVGTPQKVVESARKVKILQDLGLIAPSGSPFHKNAQTLTVVQ